MRILFSDLFYSIELNIRTFILYTYNAYTLTSEFPVLMAKIILFYQNTTYNY